MSLVYVCQFLGFFQFIYSNTECFPPLLSYQLKDFSPVPAQQDHQGLTLDVTRFHNSVGHLRKELLVNLFVPAISSRGAAAVIAAASPTAV